VGSYQSGSVGSVDTEERDGGFGRGAVGCGGGGGVTPGCGDAEGNWGAGSSCSESGAESPVGEHGGRRGDGDLRVVGGIGWGCWEWKKLLSGVLSQAWSERCHHRVAVGEGSNNNVLCN
jgi:hypothetical protein